MSRSPPRFHRAEFVRVQGNTLVVPNLGTPPVRYNNTDPKTIEMKDNRVVTAADFVQHPTPLDRAGPRKGDESSTPIEPHQ
ncbi:MAG: hypothetical protein AAF961_02580 [Planctomycetota bacterium]